MAELASAPRIDTSLVARLISHQFPRWAHLPLEPVASAGSDNAIFRLGPDLAVRLPKRESAAPQAQREHQWLPRLAPALPLLAPVPIAVGAPASDYPWSWCVVPWLPGEDAFHAPPDDLAQAARDLAGFLMALRTADPTGGPAAGRENSGRGVPLRYLDARVRRDVQALGGEIDGPAVLRVWEQALAAAEWSGPGAWVHGDLHPSNLLVRGGRVVGVLDFGLLGVGDPACDLFVAWSLLDARARPVLRQRLDCDEAMWLRGRGWAVFNAVIALAFYLTTNPTLCAMSRRTLDEVVAA